MYNASVKVVDRNEQKIIFRVYPEDLKIKYRGGQYGALGLNASEKRIDGKLINLDGNKLIKRAYSVSNSLLDEDDNLALPENSDYYEFYVDLVSQNDDEKPRLSPRLFSLNDGDKIFLGSKVVGHYTLEAKADGKNILLISTTTGESPHNSMVVEALHAGEKEVSISNISLWPKSHESMYKAKHEKLQERFSCYR